jgi:hypothetical protein
MSQLKELVWDKSSWKLAINNGKPVLQSTEKYLQSEFGLSYASRNRKKKKKKEGQNHE